MDFDGDGDQDVLSGSWPGEIYLFRRQADGDFAKGEILETDEGKPIKVGSASAVFAHDWDSDGDLDLLIGNIQGDVHLVANEGSREEPVFAADSKELQAGGRAISAEHGDAGPVVADWDGDGQADLLVGSGAGSVVWFRNVGTPEAPELAAGKVLVPAPGESRRAFAEGENPLQTIFSGLFGPGAAEQEATDEDEPERGTRAKIHVTDWNGDGRLDLLLGDFSMSSRTIRRGELSEEEKVAKKKAQKRYEEAMANYTKLSRRGRGKTGEERAEEEMQATDELFEAMDELEKYKLVRTEYTDHGRVWLFLRQPEGESRSGL